MSQVGIIPQQQPVIQQPIDDQPHVLRQKQHAPDVHMEKLTADDLKAIMSGDADITAAASKKRWSLAAKIITGIFTLGIAPAIMCSKEGRMERQSAQDALRLKDALKRFSDDPEAERQVIHMADKRVILDKTAEGGIKAYIDRQVVEAKHTAKDMVEIIEDDIVTHVDFYGKKAAEKLFGKTGAIDTNNPMDALDRTGADSRHRELCVKLIHARTGLDPSVLHSCTTKYLDRMARYALDGYYGSLKHTLDHVLTITTTNRVAAEDAKELLDAMEAQERENPGDVEQKVNIRAIRAPKPQNTTQKQVQAMMADLIYAGNIVDEDKYAGKPVERMQQVMEKNAKVIADVIITEAGVDAVKAEQKAVKAEAKAALPDASPADKAEAKALRAEANAAQYEALFLGNRVDLAPENEQRDFWPAEARAYRAEARAIRLEAANDPKSAEARAEANALRAEVRAMRAEAAYNDVGVFAEAKTKAQAKAAMLETQAEMLKARFDLLEMRGNAAGERLQALEAHGKPAPASREGREAAKLRQQIDETAKEYSAVSDDLDARTVELDRSRLDLAILENKDRLETAEEAAKKLESEHKLAGAKAGSPQTTEQDKASFKALGEKLEQARAEVIGLKAQLAVLQAKAKATDAPAAREKLANAQAALEKEGPALRMAITQAEADKAGALRQKEILSAMAPGGVLPQDFEEARPFNDAIAAADKNIREARDKLDALQKDVDDARAELRLASPEGQIDAAKQKTAEAQKASTEAQAALQKAKNDLAAAEEGSKTNKLLLFRVGLAKYSLSGAESTAKTAEQAYKQAQNDEKAIAQAFAGPLAEAEIAFGKAGAQFDIALPHKFSQFTDLPEGMQKSLLDLPGLGDGTDAIKAPLREMKETLLEQGQPPNEAVILLGLKTEDAKAMIRESAAKLDGIINKMAQGLQDEMSTMILMLDATLKPGMQAAARAIRDAVQGQGLELTEENINAVLEQEPRPQQITDAINALAVSLTGVEGNASRRRLAEKMALSTLKDYAKMSRAADEAQQKADRLSAQSKQAESRWQTLKMVDLQNALGDLQEAGTNLADVRKEITDTTQEHAQAVTAYEDKKQELEAILTGEEVRGNILKGELQQAVSAYAKTKAQVESELEKDGNDIEFTYLQKLEKDMAQKEVVLRDAQEKLSVLNITLENAREAVQAAGGDPAQKQQALDDAQKAYDAGQKAVSDAQKHLAEATSERNKDLGLMPDYVKASTQLRYDVTRAQTFLESVYTREQFNQLLQFEQELAKKEVELLYASNDLVVLGDKLQETKEKADNIRKHPNAGGDPVRQFYFQKEADLQKAYDEALKLKEDLQKAFDEAMGKRTKALESAPEFIRNSTAERYGVLLAEARKEAAAAREALALATYNGASARSLEAEKTKNTAEEIKNKLQKEASVAQTAAGKARLDADALLGVDHPQAPEGVQAGEGAAQGQAVQPANAQNLTAQQKMVADLRAKDLETIAAEAAIDFNSDGYGKFIKTVMLNYFQNASMADKRSMFSAALRYAPENADSNEVLGALLKGAGPIMQKVLQGLDGPSLPPALRVAFKDMKSNLAPIPEEVIKATLLDMVQRSNGKIASIEVVRSMGAASVGQALRCRITDSKGQTRDCIVKILRPDAPNRAARERDIFLNAAKQVSGMEGTFKGQYDKIMEELDFTIEYKNAKMGALYNNPFSGEKKVQSVKVVEDIPPSTSYMAMEIAPGDTLVGFYDSTRARLNEIGMSFGASEVFDEKGVRTSVSYTASPTQRQEIIDTKNELMQLFTETKKRYEQMLALTEVWVKEGIFGAQGFFHGDLHGGNIMSDGDTLTAIDFGNATSLSTEQQSKVITMMIAASTKQTTKFLDALRPLLTDEARQVMDAKYNDLCEALRVVMRKGGNGETGTRIGAILAVLQKYGVSIPSSLFNFSSSELRLQNSVEELGALMEEIKEDMEALGEARVNALEGTAEMFEDTNQAMQMMAQHINQQTVQNHITNGKNKVDWATELLDVPGISYDENGVIQEAGLPPEFADGGEKAAGRELLSNVIQNVNLFISQPSQVGVFYAMHVEPFPEAKAAWDSNIDKATNMQLTQAERNQARAAIMKALMKVSKDTLTQFESEVNADPVYGGRVDSFFGVVNDVCQANRAASAWKLGVVSAIKYALFDKI